MLVKDNKEKNIFLSLGWCTQADVQDGEAESWRAQRCVTWVPPPEKCQPLAAAALWQEIQ